MRTGPLRSRPKAGRWLGLALAALCGPALAQDGADVILTPLAPPGDAVRGEALVRDMTRASCLICHVLPLADEPDMGEIGPPLAGVASRLSEGELRQRLVNAKAVNPQTVMPGYFVTEGLTDVLAAYRGQPIYSAQEIEDVLAYLMTLE